MKQEGEARVELAQKLIEAQVKANQAKEDNQVTVEMLRTRIDYASMSIAVSAFIEISSVEKALNEARWLKAMEKVGLAPEIALAVYRASKEASAE